MENCVHNLVWMTRRKFEKWKSRFLFVVLLNKKHFNWIITFCNLMRALFSLRKAQTTTNKQNVRSFVTRHTLIPSFDGKFILNGFQWTVHTHTHILFFCNLVKYKNIYKNSNALDVWWMLLLECYMDKTSGRANKRNVLEKLNVVKCYSQSCLVVIYVQQLKWHS